MNTKKNSNEDVLKKTKLFLEKQEYKKALGEIQNFSNKEHPVFLYYLAFIKNNLNEKIEALKILNKLTNKETNFTEAYHLSAIINEIFDKKLKK